MSETSGNARAGGLLRQQFLLDQVMAEVAERAPDGWVRIEAIVVLLGQIRRIEYEIFTADGPYDGPPLSLFPATAPELRDAMYVEGRGTWFSLALTMWSSGEVSTSFDFDNRPPSRASLGYVVRDDLEMYPRDVLPQWMVDELAQIGTEDDDDRERSVRPSFAGAETEAVLEAGPPMMERESAREMARGFVPEEPDMSYVKVTRAVGGIADPIVIFSELDEDRYECRKVEIFGNGLLDFAGEGMEGAATWLAGAPLPPVEELVLLPKVVGAESISPEEFQVEWLVATGVQ
ncbi:DUF6881 domain-containing protein [Nocardia aurea]|uniref:DUF6881 domain-containing protein n=1 Tax=Nocardia aurea TaxID=2144174 RepID=A0ABV3G1W4_9NOCA